MKPPKFQHPLRQPALLSLQPQHPFVPSLSHPRRASPFQLWVPLDRLFPFFPFLRSLRLCPRRGAAPMPSQSADRVESVRRWRPRTLIRETRGASAGVAMTQSQRGPMDWLVERRCSAGHDWAWPVATRGVFPVDADASVVDAVDGRVGECRSVPRGVISYR